MTDADAGLEPGAEEVLAICRYVFETPIGWDEGFAEAGGHSIVIARLAQRLQAAGWAVSVRELLSDCNTARKVASRMRQLQSPAAAATVATKSAQTTAARDESAAKVLSVGRFTILQILFATLLYSPGLLAVLEVLSAVEIGTLFTTASIWTFIVAGIGLYLLSLLVPFACLLWVMGIKFFLGRDIYRNNVTPGVYPKWSKMHLRVWCIGRMESLVLLPLRAIYRSAPLTAFALRQLGATVGRNLQCASDAHLAGPLDLIAIEDDVAIQTGAYVQTTRWSGQHLLVGPVHLESGCKIGMRAAIVNNVKVGRGSWITPFTPILRDVGSHEIWEGAPARLAGRCTVLRRTESACRTAQPIWLLEACNIFMQIAVFSAISVVPAAVILWFARDFTLLADADLSSRLLPRDADARNHWVPNAPHLHCRLAHHRRQLAAELLIHSLHGHVVRAALCARLEWCTPHVPNAHAQQHPAAVDLDHYRAILAGARRHALHAHGRVRVRRDVQPRP